MTGTFGFLRPVSNWHKLLFTLFDRFGGRLQPHDSSANLGPVEVASVSFGGVQHLKPLADHQALLRERDLRSTAGRMHQSAPSARPPLQLPREQVR